MSAAPHSASEPTPGATPVGRPEPPPSTTPTTDAARGDRGDHGGGTLEVLALVTARGGSKGLPRKNVIPVLGRPLIVWTIGAALRAETVTRVVVSTDDDEIAETALAAGAEVPFRRPADLAGDTVRDLPVFRHALEWLRDAEGYTPDLVVHLRPTSPVRPPGLVDRGVRRLAAEPGADSLRVVCEPANNPFKMWRIVDDRLVPLVDSGIPEQYNEPRQALPTVYWQIGVLDVIRPATILEQGSMSGRVILPLVVDAALAVDIDDASSIPRAEEALVALGIAEDLA